MTEVRVGDIVTSPCWVGEGTISTLKYYLDKQAHNPEDGGWHGAWDISLKMGTHVRAIAGEVISARWDQPNKKGPTPNHVVIGTQLADGNYQRKASLSYIHLQPLNNSAEHQKIKQRLKPGTKLQGGELIGFVGTSGNSEGAHLHLGAQWGWSEDPFDGHWNKPHKDVIFPPDALWTTAEPTVADEPEVQAAEVSPDDATRLRPEGDFAKVKELLNPEEMRKALFNPPLPRRFSSGLTAGAVAGPGRDLSRYLYEIQKVNRPGWIVRDPFLAQQMSGNNEDAPSDTDTPPPDNSTPDNGGARSSSPDATGAFMQYQKNYGFRFLYNPETYSEGYTSMAGADPLRVMQEMATTSVALVGASGGTISFELFLYRKFDVELIRWVDQTWNRTIDHNRKILAERINNHGYYEEKLSKADVIGLLERGTMYDLEYLFRVCNGDPQETWHGKSSDWGLLMPSMVVVSLGDGPTSRRVRGTLGNLSYEHQFFAAGMIPVMTRVNLSINRISDAYFQASSSSTSSPDGDTATQ